MKRSWGAFVSSFAATSALAAPTDYVHTPDVDYGEREIDVKFGSAEREDGRERAASVGFGWTPLSRWLTELNAHWQEEPEAGTRLRAFEWENKFQLTEPGKHPFDLGLLVEVEVPSDSADGRELIVGALLQRDIGRMQLNANVLLEREFGGDEADAGEEQVVELGYQWQLRFPWRPAMQFGAQGFGAVGAWDDWATGDEQEHAAGPALFGQLHLGDDHELEYNAALLLAGSDATPHHTLRLQLEFQF